MAALPNKPFICNWNARDFDPATNSIPMTAGQSFQEDLVFPNAVTQYTDKYVSIPTANKVVFNFPTAADNPFNLSSDKGFTLVAKMNAASNASWCISDRVGSTATYGWLLGYKQDTIIFSPINDYTNPNLQYTPQTAGPHTAAIQIDNTTNYGQYISYTDNDSVGGNLSGNWWRDAVTQITFFGGTWSTEIWYGDFYWLYITNEVLTDEEIRQVIDYNENIEVFEPSQDTFSFGFDGGTQTFTVEADNAWTCAAPTDFTISPMSGNPGTTTVTITAPSRFATVSDTVTFTDSDQNTFDISISQSVGTITPNLTIYQGATTIKKMYHGSGLVYRKMAHSPSLVISGDSFTFPPTSYTAATVVVTTDANWSYSTEASWLSLTKTGNNLEIVPASDWDQGSAPRTATVTVTADNGFITKSAEITVEQDNSSFNGFYLENTYNGPNTLTVTRNGSPMSTDLAYSTDGGDNWTDIHNGGSVTVQAGEKVYLRSSTGLNARENNSFILSMNESHTAGGDIRTLIDYTDVSSVTVLPEGCFRQLFQQDTALTDASAIDFSGITRTAQDSCQYMFSNCVNLIAGMDMDDVVYVVDSSLSFMYEDCTSLTTAPSMASLVTVEAGGLYQTFRYCTSLQTGVDLRSVTSVTTVSCYYMYQGCSVLNVAYAPSVASWNTSAMSNWLSGVAASGTLYAPSGVSIPTSSSGIPSGWTLVYYGA